MGGTRDTADPELLGSEVAGAAEPATATGAQRGGAEPVQQGIANRLNVSVRTVKFHVSTLLEKFEVVGRVDLMLEAADLMSRGAVHRQKSDRDSVLVYASGFKTTLIDPGGALGVRCRWTAEGGQAERLDAGQNGRNHNQPRTASKCKNELSSSMMGVHLGRLVPVESQRLQEFLLALVPVAA
jgi:hypothetical protein